MDPTLSEQQAAQLLSGGNAPFVEDLYQCWQRDPASVSAQWRDYFSALAPADDAPQAQSPPAGTSAGAAAASEKQGAVSRLVQTLSNRGHLIARIDPLGMMQRQRPRVLDPAYVGLSESDLDTEFYTGSRNDWIGRRASLRASPAAAPERPVPSPPTVGLNVLLVGLKISALAR